MEDYLTEREVAEKWRITRRTLQRWRAAGTGPRYVKIEGSIRYCKAGLREYLKTHQIQTRKRKK
jgi:predicted DNA-binding transcriptional regulator AlpA